MILSPIFRFLQDKLSISVSRTRTYSRLRVQDSCVVEALEHRVLLTASLNNLPQKTGETFVVDDWDNKVTNTDLGFNYFAGNSGAVADPESVVSSTASLSTESNGSQGGSLKIDYDFSSLPVNIGGTAGYFASLFGLTDANVLLAGQPVQNTKFPGYFIDTHDLFRGSTLFPEPRSVDQLKFDIKLLTNQTTTLKVELMDEPDDDAPNGFDVFTHIVVGPGSDWETVTLSLPHFNTDGSFNEGSFSQSLEGGNDTSGFDPHKVSQVALIVERIIPLAGEDDIFNPDAGQFLVDNLALIDVDGSYPDLSQVAEIDGLPAPNHKDNFLDSVRATSFQYFLDFASTDPRTGGIIQDRSTFADLMTVGGVGFQLTGYTVGVGAGYITRQDAAKRTLDILRVLHDSPQGPDADGTIGHEGFFYHFLGIDGVRKLNFDQEDEPGDPPIDESLNTVELSTVDTALAIAGAVTARQYFDGDSPEEQEIRQLADAIYGRVNWHFMLYTNPPDPDNTEIKPDPAHNQFYLGWKPNEIRDDESGQFGRFLFNDAAGEGQYSSRFDPISGEMFGTGPERPATYDFYTDEATLIALLAMGSPNPDHRLGREVWDAIIRKPGDEPFVKTYPGALFTYQFASVWLDTQALGPDSHLGTGTTDNPGIPTNFFNNTQTAIQETQRFAAENPRSRATWTGENAETLWGLSAAEGPLDEYAAPGAPFAALGTDGGIEVLAMTEAEAGSGDGSSRINSRANASGNQTVQLLAGETRTFPMTFDVGGDGEYRFVIRYSNSNFNDQPTEELEVRLDGVLLATFATEDTGDGAMAWENFATNEILLATPTASGSHDLTVTVIGGDSPGIELDIVTLQYVRPLETGTVTNYAVGSSIVHSPAEAIKGLWASANLNLNGDGIHGLLHPRFGFADAFNLDIADTLGPGDTAVVLEGRALSGPWANFTGFSIDHGPMMILIDSYLRDQFVPKLFMSYPSIGEALDVLFTASIIDDGDAGFSTVGTWTTAANPSGFNGDVRNSVKGNGENIARWEFTGLPPGNYRVSATWPEHPNRATNSSFSARDAVGGNLLNTAIINQELEPDDIRIGETSWEDLFVVPVTGNTLVVELSNAANQYVIADAIRLVPTITPPSIIIDDGDAGFATTGNWVQPAAAVGRERDIRHSAAGVGNDKATWTFTGLTPGHYFVAATWLEHANRATDAPFRVIDGSGGPELAAVRINQELAPHDFTDAGSEWEQIAHVTITGTELVVELTDDANQYVIADAVRIQRTNTPPPIIIDNSDASGFSSTGVWNPAASSVGHAGNLLHSAKGDGSNVATWTFAGLAPGQYRVSATWFAYSNRATNAQFTLYDSATPLTTVQVNQQLAPGDFQDAGSGWEDLMTVTITGSKLVVELRNSANGYVIADAIRIERVGL